MIGILFGPTGVGKSTITTYLMSIHPLKYIVPTTTRAPRPAEAEKICVDDLEFDRRIEKQEFIFINELFGFRYGTPRSDFLDGVHSANLTHLLDFPIEQSEKLTDYANSIRSVILLPPSWGSLKQRLVAAGRADRISAAKFQLQSYIDLYMGEEPCKFRGQFVINQTIREAAAAAAAALQIE